MSKTLEFTRLILPGSVARGLSSHHKQRLVMLTSMMRDLDLFRKLIVYASRSQKTGIQSLDQASSATLLLSFANILISKEFEIWEFLEKENIEAEKAAFSADLLARWEKIVDFFNDPKKKDLFHFVRNKFGFHYDWYENLHSYIDNAMAEIGDLEFWMCNDMSGNDVFVSSDVVMLTVVCKKMTELGFVGTDKELVKELYKLAIEISVQINEFCKEYFVKVLAKNLQFSDDGVRVLANVPSLSEVNLPLVVARD